MDGLLETIACKMIRYFGNDLRRINHALQVHGFAKIIAGLESLSEETRFTLEVAALLHDIGIKEAEKQYQSTAGYYQELLGPDIARNLLQELNIPDSIANRIYFLIGHHHTYSKIDTIDFQILVEADFLVNIADAQLNETQITAIKQKYFKTKTGLELLPIMYN